MNNIGKLLGQKIRQIRIDRHMSQEELAFKAGINTAHLGQIERAAKNPTVDTIGKIAAALDVSITELFSDEITPHFSTNPIIEKINAHLTAMTTEEQYDMLRIIRILQSYSKKSSSNSSNDEKVL